MAPHGQRRYPVPGGSMYQPRVWRPRSNRSQRTLALITALTVAAWLIVAVATPGRADSSGGTFRPADPGAAASSTVALPTGQHVQLSTDSSGRQTALVLPTNEQLTDDAYLTLRVAGDLFVIPRSALPQLADGASVDQFDVTALAERRGPSAGQELGQPNGRFPMRTLRLTGVDELGQPAAGLAMFYLILNVDNGNRFAYFSSMATGYRNISVPVGHYAVFGFFSRQDKQTG